MKKSLTNGLTHIALIVKNVDTSNAFYKEVFDAKTMYRNEGFGQIQTVGSDDIIVFEEDKKKSALIGKTGGLLHFGFRLRKPGDLDNIVDRVVKAGGIIIDKGEFCPGEPYVFFKDPDGYEVEVWYELES